MHQAWLTFAKRLTGLTTVLGIAIIGMLLSGNRLILGTSADSYSGGGTQGIVTAPNTGASIPVQFALILIVGGCLFLAVRWVAKPLMGRKSR